MLWSLYGIILTSLKGVTCIACASNAETQNLSEADIRQSTKRTDDDDDDDVADVAVASEADQSPQSAADKRSHHYVDQQQWAVYVAARNNIW